MRKSTLAIAIFWMLLELSVHGAVLAGHIEWDHSTLTLVAEGGGYARMIRTRSQEILCVFDRDGTIWVRRSTDDGKTWMDSVRVAGYDFGHATNPELLELRNGWILCTYNERPTDGVHPFAIVTCLSKDGGHTWSAGQRVYTAGTRWENGCWEPAAIQLPSGEIQLFFANEGPYRTTAEQEITMLRSRDNAATWSDPRTISFRTGHRDGMPVPLVLKDGGGIVVAIEDNGINGHFKPVIIHSSFRQNWKQGFADGRSPRRWAALDDPLPAEVPAAAPYICQMPTGETVLSVQTTDAGRRKPRMVVYIGGRTGRNFTSPSAPFDVGPGTACLWNSLFVKDANTVTAIAGTVIDGVGGIWAIDGRLIRSRERAGKPRGENRNRRRQREPMAAVWNHSVDGGREHAITLYANGKINDPNGTATWSLNGRMLVLRWPDSSAPGGVWIDTCQISADWRTYMGKNQSGNVIHGTRVTTADAETPPVDRTRPGNDIDRRVPDPAIIEAHDGAGYYIFASGPGVGIWHSDDLKAWKRIGRVFVDSVPAWTREFVPTGAAVWAPDIRFVDGTYYLFYSVSTMGSQRSVIGLTVNSTLDPDDPSYEWRDRGFVLDSSPDRHDYNAIDPALFVDDDGRTYLFWGSFWTGIKAAAIDLQSGKLTSPIAAVARRRPDASTSIEGPYVIKRNGQYYLFVSWGTCCDGSESTYKVMVGRARSPLVPFVDDTGRSMNDGGGTLVLMGGARWRGPGHNSVLQTSKGDWLVHHVIDAQDPRAGRVLQIRLIQWINDWPVVGQAVGVEPHRNRTSPLVGRWIHAVEDNQPSEIFFEANGAISGPLGEARWEQKGNLLRLMWMSPDAPGGYWIDEVRLSRDGRSYAGKNQIGVSIRGTQRQRWGQP